MRLKVEMHDASHSFHIGPMTMAILCVSRAVRARINRYEGIKWSGHALKQKQMKYLNKQLKWAADNFYEIKRK